MAINTAPIYSGEPDNQWATIATAANTTADLTSGTIYLIWTANATNGGYLSFIRAQPAGTNSNATALKFWENNGSTTGTAANNTRIDQVSLPATTNTETAFMAPVDTQFNRFFNIGHRIYATLGTAPTSAGHFLTAFGGSYEAQ